MNAREKSDSSPLVASNRKARHDYAILDEVEAGIVLLGSEVKSARAGQVQLADAYAHVVNGEMSGGFALIAWPAQYDASGVMTFMVGQDGVTYEKELGPDTPTAATAITRFDPDATWRKAVADTGAQPPPED